MFLFLQLSASSIVAAQGDSGTKIRPPDTAKFKDGLVHVSNSGARCRKIPVDIKTIKDFSNKSFSFTLYEMRDYCVGNGGCPHQSTCTDGIGKTPTCNCNDGFLKTDDDQDARCLPHPNDNRNIGQDIRFTYEVCHDQDLTDGWQIIGFEADGNVATMEWIRAESHHVMHGLSLKEAIQDNKLIRTKKLKLSHALNTNACISFSLSGGDRFNRLTIDQNPGSAADSLTLRMFTLATDNIPRVEVHERNDA